MLQDILPHRLDISFSPATPGPESRALVFDGEKLQNAKFHITMGLYEARLDKLTEMETALTEAGVPYTQALYEGGHDWFVWRASFVDYVTDLLWK